MSKSSRWRNGDVLPYRMDFGQNFKVVDLLLGEILRLSNQSSMIHSQLICHWVLLDVIWNIFSFFPPHLFFHSFLPLVFTSTNPTLLCFLCLCPISSLHTCTKPLKSCIIFKSASLSFNSGKPDSLTLLLQKDLETNPTIYFHGQ